MKTMVRSSDSDSDFFEIVAGILKGFTLTPYMFIICLNCELQTLIGLIIESAFTVNKTGNRAYLIETMTNADYVDDLVLLINTPAQA